MKKLILVICIILFALLLGACSRDYSTQGGDPVAQTVATMDMEATRQVLESYKTQTAEAQNEDWGSVYSTSPFEAHKMNTAVNVSESLIYDGDGVKVTVKSLVYDAPLGPQLQFFIENNSQNAITLHTRDVVVNNFMVDAQCDAVVDAGTQSYNAMSLMMPSLAASGINTLQYIEFNLRILGTGSGALTHAITTERIRVNTDADPGFVQAYDTSGTLLMDREGLRLLLKKVETAQSPWGARYWVFIENNTDTDISVLPSELMVNGIKISPVYRASLLAGTKAFDELILPLSEMQTNGINNIREISISFQVLRRANQEQLFKTEILSLSFD